MKGLIVIVGSLAGVCALLLAAGLFLVEPGFLVIAATSSGWKAVTFLATQRIRLMNGCPAEHFIPESPVGFVVNGYGDPDADDRKILEVADAFIGIGCDPDQYGAFGLTALHNAVVAGQPVLVGFLLDRGANPQLRVREVEGQMTGKTIVGLDSLQLAERLATMDPDRRDRAMLLQMLRQGGAGG